MKQTGKRKRSDRKKRTGYQTDRKEREISQKEKKERSDRNKRKRHQTDKQKREIRQTEKKSKNDQRRKICASLYLIIKSKTDDII